MTPQHRSRNCVTGRQAGVGLIEILIAVILLSIGFLAAAKMQVEGMRFSQSAYYQSQAYFLAADMLDRMRANHDGVQQGHYDNITTTAAASNPGCGPSTVCNTSEMAAQDLYEWSAQLHPLDAVSNFTPALPGAAKGTVTPVPGSNGIYTVTLEWTELVEDQESTQSLSVNIATEQNAL